MIPELPVVMQCANVESKSKWISENLVTIQKRIAAFGAVLIRGFKTWTEAEFREFVTAVGGDEPLDYIYRSTPRTTVGQGVYTATEYPAGLSIPLHNENAYQRDWPMLLSFVCEHPADGGGGQTTLANTEKVTQQLDSAIKEKFREKRVMYIRNYRSDIDLPWQVVFQTESRQDVEEYCRVHDIMFEWTPEGNLRTRQVCNALSTHPWRGTEIWFNQAHLFHPSSLDARTREVMRQMFKDEDLPRNATYGDGSPLEESVLQAVREAFSQETLNVDWRKGDVLLLDNMRVSHGRNPYKGKRKVLTAMARPFSTCASTPQGSVAEQNAEEERLQTASSV